MNFVALFNCLSRVESFNLKFSKNNTSLLGDAVAHICDVSTVFLKVGFSDRKVSCVQAGFQSLVHKTLVRTCMLNRLGN